MSCLVNSGQECDQWASVRSVLALLLASAAVASKHNPADSVMRSKGFMKHPCHLLDSVAGEWQACELCTISVDNVVC